MEFSRKLFDAKIIQSHWNKVSYVCFIWSKGMSSLERMDAYVLVCIDYDFFLYVLLLTIISIYSMVSFLFFFWFRFKSLSFWQSQNCIVDYYFAVLFRSENLYSNWIIQCALECREQSSIQNEELQLRWEETKLTFKILPNICWFNCQVVMWLKLFFVFQFTSSRRSSIWILPQNIF